MSYPPPLLWWPNTRIGWLRRSRSCWTRNYAACRWRAIYGAEIDAFRQQGRRLAEATCLADRELGIREFVCVFKTLIKVGMQYHLRPRRGIAGSSRSIPDTGPSIRRCLGFVPLGPRRLILGPGSPGRSLHVGCRPAVGPCPGDVPGGFGRPLPEQVLKVAPLVARAGAVLRQAVDPGRWPDDRAPPSRTWSVTAAHPRWQEDED